MKLSKIKFAQVIGFIERQHALNLSTSQIEYLDDIIDVDILAPQQVIKATVKEVDDLLRQMLCNEFIPSIKAYRTLTGAGLKESKEAIERYRYPQPAKQQS